jgi:antitoxin (DNA-binding transcriptional repressor) of toxin-antitoxin stability system
LSQLVARAEKGERIVIARAGKPVAQLGPPSKAERRLPSDDPLLNLDSFAIDGPRGKLTNAEIDRSLYGRR